MVNPYCPERGDIIWIDFDPQSGREIQKHRPALVVSPKGYNKISGLCLVCPISSKMKGHLFEIAIKGLSKPGVVKSDQLRSFDWRASKAVFIQKAPKAVLQSTIGNIVTLLTE